MLSQIDSSSIVNFVKRIRVAYASNGNLPEGCRRYPGRDPLPGWYAITPAVEGDEPGGVGWHFDTWRQAMDQAQCWAKKFRYSPEFWGQQWR